MVNSGHHGATIGYSATLLGECSLNHMGIVCRSISVTGVTRNKSDICIPDGSVYIHICILILGVRNRLTTLCVQSFEDFGKC